MTYIYDDGGRAAAGFKGKTGDCVTRAIAIATQTPYKVVYDALHMELHGAGYKGRHASPRNGIYREIYQSYLEGLGWRWVPTMEVGKGCQVHLNEKELISGRIICRLSKHLCAVIDGVVHDTHDCSRNGTRCVYGYFYHSPY